jgi:hypothetical protein
VKKEKTTAAKNTNQIKRKKDRLRKLSSRIFTTRFFQRLHAPAKAFQVLYRQSFHILESLSCLTSKAKSLTTVKKYKREEAVYANFYKQPG